MTGPRWPLQPLLDAGITPTQLRLHLGGRGYTDALHNGLNDRQADRIAITHGHHPLAIWGWAWVDAVLTVNDHHYLEGGWRQAWLWHEQGAA